MLIAAPQGCLGLVDVQPPFGPSTAILRGREWPATEAEMGKKLFLFMSSTVPSSAARRAKA